MTEIQLKTINFIYGSESTKYELDKNISWDIIDIYDASSDFQLPINLEFELFIRYFGWGSC